MSCNGCEHKARNQIECWSEFTFLNNVAVWLHACCSGWTEERKVTKSHHDAMATKLFWYYVCTSDTQLVLFGGYCSKEPNPSLPVANHQDKKECIGSILLLHLPLQSYQTSPDTFVYLLQTSVVNIWTVQQESIFWMEVSVLADTTSETGGTSGTNDIHKLQNKNLTSFQLACNCRQFESYVCLPLAHNFVVETKS